LTGNPITAVSGDALAGLNYFSSLKLLMGDEFTKCSLVSSKAIISCKCAEGYANDPRWPSYCGKAVGVLGLILFFQQNHLNRVPSRSPCARCIDMYGSA
jgi:hypothetical protein